MRSALKCKHHGCHALTLVEVLVALAVLGIAMGGTIIALMQIERRAFQSRLVTCAQTLAQNQIDRVLYEPYVPQNGADGIPGILKPGGTPVAGGQTAVHFWDFEGESSPLTGDDEDEWYSVTTQPVPVYDPDPGESGEAGETIGEVVITVENPSHQHNSVNLNTLAVTVTVNYNYLGREYGVRMRTLRASDL